MRIKIINLSNFRNFKSKIFEFSPKTTVIIGPNASGKTNILEAIYLLSSGKSFKARLEEEMVNYASEIARVKGRASSAGSTSRTGESTPITNHKSQITNLEIILTRGEVSVGEDSNKKQSAPRKKLLLNGVPRRLFTFAGNLKVVLFGPWDLELVTESPSVRRRFLDAVLSQVDYEYRRASLSYEKGLRQRNRLLWQIRENSFSLSSTSIRSRLLFWDKLLIKNGDYINQRRREFIEFANAGNYQLPISNYQLKYDPSSISQERLEQYAEEEVAAASTLVGPHRDDFVFKKSRSSRTSSTSKSGRDLARFGSRGEQRMSVLWLKLAELAYIKKVTQEHPVLLLDDIFSELDHEHREIVVDIIKNSGQVIITTADPHNIEEIKGVKKISLKD